MPTVAENATSSQTQMAATLATGVDTLSFSQSITFNKYIRVMLPLDGFVFWVNAAIVGSEALATATRFNRMSSDFDAVVTAPATLTIPGSLHYATTREQEEEKSYSRNEITFTAEAPVNDFNQSGPAVLFIGEFEGTRFAFSSRGSYYVQAGLHHYTGTAVYSVIADQLIDSVDQLNLNELVVSNSMPIWLGLDRQTPYPGSPLIDVPIFPAKMVPFNFAPPFATVLIHPDSTQVMASSPLVGQDSSRWQLAKERVVVTMYGMRNADALDFVQSVCAFSLNTELIGIMNMPTVRDDRQQQTELGVLAIRKSVEFEINYLQGRVLDVARALITKAIIPSYTTN